MFKQFTFILASDPTVRILRWFIQLYAIVFLIFFNHYQFRPIAIVHLYHSFCLSPMWSMEQKCVGLSVYTTSVRRDKTSKWVKKAFQIIIIIMIMTKHYEYCFKRNEWKDIYEGILDLKIYTIKVECFWATTTYSETYHPNSPTIGYYANPNQVVYIYLYDLDYQLMTSLINVTFWFDFPFPSSESHL